jgi:hypothetical protein
MYLIPMRDITKQIIKFRALEGRENIGVRILDF